MIRKFVAFIWCLCITVIHGQIRVVSYNLRYNNPNDSANAWPNRLSSISKQLQGIDFDFLGTQEGLYSQLTDIESSLGTNYRWIGIGRDAGDTRGEFSAIFYNSTKFELVNSKNGFTNWLSTTPNKPSKGWDAALPRIVTFGEFREKNTGKIFWIFNTHFDHMGDTARLHSAELIIKLISEYSPNVPIILTGDFNSKPNSHPIQFLSKHLHNAQVFNPLSISLKGTFNGFSKDTEHSGPIIDYIFSKRLSVTNFWVDYATRGPGLYLSDHYPVIAEFKFN